MQRIVIPGEKISDTAVRMHNTLIHNGKTYSMIVGLYNDEKSMLIPLEGLWHPAYGDTVVGVIEEDRLNTYNVTLNSPYKGLLISKFVQEQLNKGDLVEASVKELDKTQTVVLMRPRKLSGGKVFSITPSKVPRVLGKGNNMLRELSASTKSTIIVGHNGVIWLKGGNTQLAMDAILRIQEEAHTTGLTDRIKEMLSKGS